MERTWLGEDIRTGAPYREGVRTALYGLAQEVLGKEVSGEDRLALRGRTLQKIGVAQEEYGGLLVQEGFTLMPEGDFRFTDPENGKHTYRIGVKPVDHRAGAALDSFLSAVEHIPPLAEYESDARPTWFDRLLKGKVATAGVVLALGAGAYGAFEAAYTLSNVLPNMPDSLSFGEALKYISDRAVSRSFAWELFSPGYTKPGLPLAMIPLALWGAASAVVVSKHRKIGSLFDAKGRRLREKTQTELEGHVSGTSNTIVSQTLSFAENFD